MTALQSTSFGGLFDEFQDDEIAKIAQAAAREREETAKAVAAKARHRHLMRRATAEKTLADILPDVFETDDSYHVISRGDIDSLSYLRHALAGAGHFDHVLISTWCIAKADMDELAGWLDTGRIDQLDLHVGEIFPSQYGDEYEAALKMVETYGARLVVAKNHSKVTLCAKHSPAYYLAIESSANVNTNPRIEQTAIHASRDLYHFYLEFFDGIKSIDRASRPTS